MQVVPYQEKKTSKKAQVAEMFNNISGRYDFLNHVLSFGIDHYWRWRAVNLLRKHRPRRILDIATGTGDFALAALRLQPEKIIGVDISTGMLTHGRRKVAKRQLEDKIELREGDSEQLDFESHYFDAVIVSFGVRNFENLARGLADMYRVLRPGGAVVILEFSKPRRFPVKQIYQFYFQYVLPTVGRWVSGDGAAYRYLPASVQQFPEGEVFVEILNRTGFTATRAIPLTFGISSIYYAEKPAVA